MNFTEGFGKKWIDRILGKVDKDQGVANAGKVLGIGNDGQVVPVEQSGGGSTDPFGLVKYTVPNSAYMYFNHNDYDVFTLSTVPMIFKVTYGLCHPRVNIVSIDDATSTIHVTITSDNGWSGTKCGYVNGHANQYSSSEHTIQLSTEFVVDHYDNPTAMKDNVEYRIYFRNVVPVSMNKQKNSANGSYRLDRTNYMECSRTSDNKKYTVIDDSAFGYSIINVADAKILEVYAPPNVISLEPFPDA